MMKFSRLNKWILTEKCYQWEALDNNGMRVKGKHVFPTDIDFKQFITQQKLTLIHYRTKSHITLQFFSKKSQQKKQAAQFIHELTELLKSDLTLGDALHILAKTHSHSPMKKLIDRTKANIEKGMDLSQSLQQEGGQFDQVSTSLIAAGEQSGNLATLCQTLTTHLFAMQALRNKIKRALYYPATILIVALIISLGLIWFAVPQFQNVYRSLGSKLPPLTQKIIHISNHLHHYLPVGFTTIVAFLFLARILYLRNETLRLTWQRISLQLPWINRWTQLRFLSQWSKVLATTLKAGLPVLTCLQLCERSTNNSALQQQLKKVTTDVSTGQPLFYALSKQTPFPKKVSSLIEIGEASGNLADTLQHLSNQYQQKLDEKISSFTKLLEPIIMIILAAIIGTIVIALYLPVFNLGHAI